MAELTNLIEGVYDLIEWRRGDETFRPPVAAGRTVWLNGTVTLVMRCDAERWASHRYGIGRYVIDGDRLRYGYDRMFDHSRNGTDARSMPDAPVAGLRPYRLRDEGGCLVCEGETHGSTIRFSRDGVLASDGRDSSRLWRRVAGMPQ